MTSTVSLKLKSKDGTTIRRLTFSPASPPSAFPPTWDDLSRKISLLFPIPPDKVAVSYIDEEEDEVTLSSQEELLDFYSTNQTFLKGDLVKFTVEDLRIPRRAAAAFRTSSDDPPTPPEATAANFRNTFGGSLSEGLPFNIDEDWHHFPSALSGLFSVNGAEADTGSSLHAFVEEIESAASTISVAREETTSITDSDSQVSTVLPPRIDKGKARATEEVDEVSSTASLFEEETFEKPDIHVYDAASARKNSRRGSLATAANAVDDDGRSTSKANSISGKSTPNANSAGGWSIPRVHVQVVPEFPSATPILVPSAPTSRPLSVVRSARTSVSLAPSSTPVPISERTANSTNARVASAPSVPSVTDEVEPAAVDLGVGDLALSLDAASLAQGTNPSLSSDVADFLRTLASAVASHPELSEGFQNILRNAAAGTYWSSAAGTTRGPNGQRDSIASSAQSIITEQLNRSDIQAGKRVADALGVLFQTIGQAVNAPHQAATTTAATGAPTVGAPPSSSAVQSPPPTPTPNPWSFGPHAWGPTGGPWAAGRFPGDPRRFGPFGPHGPPPPPPPPPPGMAGIPPLPPYPPLGHEPRGHRHSYMGHSGHRGGGYPDLLGKFEGREPRFATSRAFEGAIERNGREEKEGLGRGARERGHTPQSSAELRSQVEAAKLLYRAEKERYRNAREERREEKRAREEKRMLQLMGELSLQRSQTIPGALSNSADPGAVASTNVMPTRPVAPSKTQTTPQSQIVSNARGSFPQFELGGPLSSTPRRSHTLPAHAHTHGRGGGRTLRRNSGMVAAPVTSNNPGELGDKSIARIQKKLADMGFTPSAHPDLPSRIRTAVTDAKHALSREQEDDVVTSLLEELVMRTKTPMATAPAGSGPDAPARGLSRSHHPDTVRPSADPPPPGSHIITAEQYLRMLIARDPWKPHPLTQQEIIHLRRECVALLAYSRRLESRREFRGSYQHEKEVIKTKIAYQLRYWRTFRLTDLPMEILSNIIRFVIWSAPTPTIGIRWRLQMTWISRYLRHAAISDSTLWNAIWFRDDPPFERSLAWLERSGASPLDLRINDTEKRRYTDQEISALLQALAPHLHHIRMLIILLDNWEPILSVLKWLSTYGKHNNPPLILERFEIHRTGNPYIWPGTVHQGQTFVPVNHDVTLFSLFGGADVPTLKSFTMNGVHINWVKSPSLADLDTLDIRRIPLYMCPPLHRFRQMLITSPNLTKLSLDGAGPSSDPTSISAYPPVELPQLQTLVLANFAAPFTTSICSHFTAPHVRDLTIMNFKGNDYAVLPNPAKNDQVVRLDATVGLHTMKPFPAIQAQPNLYQKIGMIDNPQLDPATAATSDASDKDREPRLISPRLTILEVQNLAPAVFAEFVEARKICGVPIQRVYLGKQMVEALSKARANHVHDMVAEFMIVDIGTKTMEEEQLLNEP
ncbi:hypothetical protein D9757_004673 [Collybiopsis confluens]|uniref:PB1 domain-containing protein n=1 Tax=Collybiopsis confluens TaxID=2823264 RepID=A0A8H5HS69_9AGAR|nr:hypothetical protein D9757_004673 [Collybiopsis confluens]